MSDRNQRIEVFNDTQDWIKNDPALSASIDVAKKNTTVFYEDDYPAFDLSKTTNLSESEKSALIYVLGNKYKLQTVSGTFEQLRKDGYIDKDLLEFKNGILFSFEVIKQSENSFMFNAEKWRSGIGAYFFNECKAKKINGIWDYKIGSEAIS